MVVMHASRATRGSLSGLPSILAILASVSLFGCSEGTDRTAEILDAGPPPDASPDEPLPSSCDVPERPAPLDHDSVVGDGTPAGCTREALAAVVATGGNVTFDCGAEPVTIPFGGEVLVGADTIIDGGGLVTFDGGGTSRLLVADWQVSLTVIGLGFVRGLATTTNGRDARGAAILGGGRGALSVFDCVFVDNAAGGVAEEKEEGGGAIFVNGGTLLIVGSTFRGNSGGLGGAVYNMLAGLTVVSSVFESNWSNSAGGALMTDGASTYIVDGAPPGVIDLCGCRFSDNSGHMLGGAAYLYAYAPDEVVVNQCLFERNSVLRDANGAAGGGALCPGNAPVRLANSLFVDNHADSEAGGLWCDSRNLTQVENCTFTRNSAGVAGTDGGYGGAISGGNLAIRNVTIADNHAEASGGGIFNPYGPVSLDDSILSGSTAGNEWGLAQSCTDPMQGAHNLQWPAPSEQDIACTTGAIAADPLLGELSDNGGPTMTIALLAGSPAIDAGEGCLATDQRGLPRTGSCDLGAFEVQ
jgi:hypothetical protein